MEVPNDFHDTQTIHHVCCEFVKNRNENANVATDWFFLLHLYARRLSDGTDKPIIDIKDYLKNT